MSADGRRGTDRTHLHRLVPAHCLADPRATRVRPGDAVELLLSSLSVREDGLVLRDASSRLQCLCGLYSVVSLQQAIIRLRSRASLDSMCVSTNGKVEGPNRTLATEWAHARPYATDESAAQAPPNAFTTSRGRTPRSSSPADHNLRELHLLQAVPFVALPKDHPRLCSQSLDVHESVTVQPLLLSDGLTTEMSMTRGVLALSAVTSESAFRA